MVFGILLILWPSVSQADVNPAVKALMPLLTPAKASEEVKPGDFKAAQERMIRILEFLEKHEGASGKRVQDLLINAFYIYERDRFSGQRKMMTRGALLRNWEKARELGLFDKNGKFGRHISLGGEKGKIASFEYIVSAGKYPVFSTDLSNLRIVTPETKRKKGAGPSAWDLAYRTQLENIEDEVLHGLPDELGRTSAENLALWKGEVEIAGDEFKKAPNFGLSGKVTATPSGKSGNRWRVTFQTTNISRHPTQVTAEYYIFGIAEKGGKLYLLQKKSEELKARSSERREVEVWTDPRIMPLNLRGWVIRILHNGKEIAWEASQPIIYEDYLPKIGSIPRQPKKRKRKR